MKDFQNGTSFGFGLLTIFVMIAVVVSYGSYFNNKVEIQKPFEYDGKIYKCNEIFYGDELGK